LEINKMNVYFELLLNNVVCVKAFVSAIAADVDWV
jgi:hypothetical protein